MERLVIPWSKLTTLELNLGHYNGDGPTVSVGEVARVLQAVSHNLIHLSWMGSWHCRSNSGVWESRMAAELSRLQNIFGGPQLVLPSLHSLTLADKDDQFQFSEIFLPRIVCPKLEELRVLLCTADQTHGNGSPGESVAKLPITGLRQLLHESTNLRQVTILHAGFGGFRRKMGQDRMGGGTSGVATCGYLVFHGTRESLRSQVVDRLAQDAGFSSQLSLLSLSQNSPEATKVLLRRIMAFVPWYAYTNDAERQRQNSLSIFSTVALLNNRHLIRPVAKTSREKIYGANEGLLNRMFTFVRDIARAARLDPQYGTLPAVDQVVWGDMSPQDLSILASIIDSVRDSEHDIGSLHNPCIFTVAVPRGQFERCD